MFPQLALYTMLFASAGMAAMPEQEFEALRQKMLNRQRKVIYNTDGCDALYFPRKWEGTKENLKKHRLRFTEGTRIDSVFYCPICSGFGNLTCRTTVGDQLVADPPHDPNARNITKELLTQGTDPLAVAQEYCQEHNLEFFASIRFNDTHDQGHTPEKPFFLMSPYKIAHPEFLMGSHERKPPRCAWSAVDFTHKEVRQHQADMIREICTNYNLDGIEYDFMRHMQLLRSVAWNGTASRDELDMMTSFMRELRAITEEIGRKRNRPILVAIRIPDSIEYSRAVGIDIERWLQEKLVDIVTASGYFQLNKWHVSAELVHKYHAKFYASLDESRISNPKAIPGRGTPEFYYARIAAAMADGCDGIYHFNLEYSMLNLIAKINPDKTEGYGKSYFATERGSGGYRSWHFLKDGDSYNNLPKIDPAEPLALTAGKPYVFSITVGDNLTSPDAAAKSPSAQVKIQTNLSDIQQFQLTCNGTTIFPTSFNQGFYRYDIPIALLVKGENTFSLALLDEQAPTPVVNDFVLDIQYQEPPPVELLEAVKQDKLPTTYMTIAEENGRLAVQGIASNSYVAECLSSIDNGIQLIHSKSAGKGYQCVTCKDPAIVEGSHGIIVARWRCKAVAIDHDQPCFQVALAPSDAMGQVVEVNFRLRADSILCSLGEIDTQGLNPLEWNDYAFAINMETHLGAFLVNGAMARYGFVSQGGNRPSGFCHVGDGSGSISGIAALGYFVLGNTK